MRSPWKGFFIDPFIWVLFKLKILIADKFAADKLAGKKFFPRKSLALQIEFDYLIANFRKIVIQDCRGLLVFFKCFETFFEYMWQIKTSMVGHRLGEFGETKIRPVYFSRKKLKKKKKK